VLGDHSDDQHRILRLFAGYNANAINIKPGSLSLYKAYAILGVKSSVATVSHFRFEYFFSLSK
jgi:hypothetical protein